MISRAPPLLFAQSFSTQAHKVGSNAVGVKRPFGALGGAVDYMLYVVLSQSKSLWGFFLSVPF